MATQDFIVSTNPARGYEEIGRVTVTNPAQIAEAVTNSKEALKSWRNTSVVERAQFLLRFRENLKSELENIAKLQSTEMGKPLNESRGEVKAILGWLKWHTSEAPRILAPRELDIDGKEGTKLFFEPYGVAASIAPWNFPTYQFVLNSAQLLLAGNTVILKHSEECPLTAQLLTSLMDRAGFPPGVFQCIYGAGETGRELLSQDVQLVSFTGSTRAGREIYQTASKKFIPAILEMGGSSPGIVFDDVDIATVCGSVFAERFSNAGQVCCALKRLIVQRSILDKVLAGISEEIQKQVVGDPLDERTTIGPLSAKRQLEVLNDQVSGAVAEGARVIIGGKPITKLNGAYFEPTLMTNITPRSRIWREEVFGPVLPVIAFDDESEAIKLANDTEYGLSAFVYSKDSARASRVAAQLQAGQVSINGCSYFSNHAPFGGYKLSGLGRADGELGYYSISQAKVVAAPLG